MPYVVDGLQACYERGPGANPKFVYDANVLLIGTDPVAVDAVAHDIIVKYLEGELPGLEGDISRLRQHVPCPRSYMSVLENNC